MSGKVAPVRPWRSLGLLALIMVAMAVWTLWPGQSRTPKLGLDLRGGTQVILAPKVAEGTGDITDEQIKQSTEIIRQRVNAFGVAEADVTQQGSGRNAAIVVSVPGVNQQQIAEQISQTALLDFRPVIQEEAGTPTTKSSKPQPKQPIQADSNSKQLQADFAALDCSDPANTQGGVPDNPAQWLVTCSTDGQVKYLLEPAFIKGTNVDSAQAQLAQDGSGGWQVQLKFDGEGSKALAAASSKLSKLPPPTNQFAIVLDGLVQSSPYFQEAILGGEAVISGKFTAEEARALANVLKYGALPLTLELAEVTTVSPTLGNDQLQAGLIAAALGLALVVLYLMVYYRALGLVAVFSLIIAAAMTYMTFVLLSRQVGLALTLAGITGAVVAIGITADSFVVYFERIRDEIREGRSLRAACEVGWSRARNTILAADFVSLLAAVILYFLSVGGVRGFAFVLGLTTLIDVIVAFLFTRPLVTLLARWDWFTSGSPMTGLDPRRLGVESVAGTPVGTKGRKPAKPRAGVAGTAGTAQSTPGGEV